MTSTQHLLWYNTRKKQRCLRRITNDELGKFEAIFCIIYDMTSIMVAQQRSWSFHCCWYFSFHPLMIEVTPNLVYVLTATFFNHLVLGPYVQSGTKDSLLYTSHELFISPLGSGYDSNDVYFRLSEPLWLPCPSPRIR